MEHHDDYHAITDIPGANAVDPDHRPDDDRRSLVLNVLDDCRSNDGDHFCGYDRLA